MVFVLVVSSTASHAHVLTIILSRATAKSASKSGNTSAYEDDDTDTHPRSSFGSSCVSAMSSDRSEVLAAGRFYEG